MNDTLPLTCWVCGNTADAQDRHYGPMCDACQFRLLLTWSRHRYDDFTCDDRHKGHMWYMQHPCSVGFATNDRAWCWCGRELIMPSITPRWETELNDILQRLGVA